MFGSLGGNNTALKYIFFKRINFHPSHGRIFGAKQKGKAQQSRDGRPKAAKQKGCTAGGQMDLQSLFPLLDLRESL